MLRKWIASKCIDHDVPIARDHLARVIDDAYAELHHDEGLSLPIVLLLPAMLVLLGMLLLWDRLGRPTWLFVLAGFCAMLTFAASGLLIPLTLVRGRIRRRVRDLGYDICMDCGYWLRGLDDSVERCPECGAQREARGCRGLNGAERSEAQ